MPLDDECRRRGRRAVCLALGAALVAAVPETGAAQAESVSSSPAGASWKDRIHSVSPGLAGPSWEAQAEAASRAPAQAAPQAPVASAQAASRALAAPAQAASRALAASAQAASRALAAPAQGPQGGPRRPAQRPYAKPEPAYAPWGRMAMRIVQNRYPNAAIVDYLHVGRRNPSATTAQETFKLWLRQGKQEFGVYVTITFNPKTKRVLRTDLRKTAR